MSWTPQQKQNLQHLLLMTSPEVDALEALLPLAKELTSSYSTYDSRTRVVVLTELLNELRPLLQVNDEIENFKTAVLKVYKQLQQDGKI